MFSLRYYQTEAVDAIRVEWEKVQSTAAVLCTGAGKTEIYLYLAVSEPGRSLVMAHRDYLLDQPIGRLMAHGFDDVAVEKAEQRSETGYAKSKVVFASVQSLCKPARLATFDPFDFSQLVIDEGHRATATTYRRVIDHFRQNPRCRVLILTATPKRKDGVALGNVCDSVAYTYSPQQASKDGWIVPLRFFRREVEGLDFSRVALKGNDLNPEQVEALLMQEKPLHEVCASLAEDRGPTIIFCPGVAVARAYAALMNQRYRRDRAVVLWADSPDEERETAAKKMAQGELDYCFNVDLFTEGYDVPELARVVWAAPTASLVRFTQGTGRVFRPHSSLRGQLIGDREETPQRRLLIEQSPKPFGAVVTYYPQNCKHQLCEPNDILGGDDLPNEVRTAAKRIQEATAAQVNGSNPDDDIETAQKLAGFMELIDRRRRNIKAKATVRDVEYDAMGGSRNRAASESAASVKTVAKELGGDWPPGDSASAKQIGWLRWKGIRNAGELGLTRFRAVVIRDLMEMGVKPETALSYGKRQALAVRKNMQGNNGGQA